MGAIILWPLHATGDLHLTGLNLLTLGNMSNQLTVRLWANLLLSYLYIGKFCTRQ